MDFERIKKAWQEENERIVVHGDVDAMLARVRRRQKRFLMQLIASDVLEVLACLVLAGVFIWVSRLLTKAPQLLYLGAGALLLLGAFFVVDRLRQEWGWKSRTTADEMRHYLLRIDRRINLLRNVLWWYLLPAAFAWAMFMSAALIETWPGWQTNFWMMVNVYGTATALAVGTFVFIYFLNQWAIQDDLIPLRCEIERVVNDLSRQENQ